MPQPRHTDPRGGRLARDDAEDAGAALDRLVAVETDGQQTQRGLAQRLGIALGLTNAYLRRAVRKGLVKVREAPARRYAYYLTPRGFAEKARLTQTFLRDSFGFFRRARAECDEALRAAAAAGHRRILLAGGGELAEIAAISARDHDIELVALLDPGRNAERFLGLQVVRSTAEAGTWDAILLTDIAQPQARYDELAATLSPARILVLPMLRVTPRTGRDR
jgi:DNA-binding MarR family transcriptional regulator